MECRWSGLESGWGGERAREAEGEGRAAVLACGSFLHALTCGVVACLAAMALMAASSVSGGEAWKAFIAFCPPPSEECAVTGMACSPQ